MATDASDRTSSGDSERNRPKSELPVGHDIPSLDDSAVTPAPAWLDSGITYPPGIGADVGFPVAQSRAAAQPGGTDAASGRDPVADFFGRAREIGAGLAPIEAERGAAIERMERDYTGLLDRDRQQMQRAFEATSAAKDAIPPPWDSDRERSARINDPIANFGSIGSIFAMVASAFTRAPMTSALNASAAAMIAIRNNDEKAYESAYDAWKQNTQLALKRFEMEKVGFDQAQHLLTTDMNAWRQAMLVNAAKFDNRKAQFMLANGMDKELIETMAAGSRAAAQVAETYEKIESFEIRRQLYKDSVAEFERNNPDADPATKMRNRLETWQDIQTGRKTVEETLLRRFYAENPHASAQEGMDFIATYRQFGRGPGSSSNQALAAIAAQVRAEGELTDEGAIWEEALRRRAAANQAPQRGPKAGTFAHGVEERVKAILAANPGMDPIKARDQATREETLARHVPPNTDLTNDRQRAAAKAAYRKKLEAERDADPEIKMSDQEIALAAERYEANLKTASQVLSSNRASSLRGRVNTIGLFRDAMDRATTLLNKNWGLAGLSGTILRPMEGVANMAGITDKTERKEFERLVAEMKEWGPLIFQDRSGRPLSSEAALMSTIVPGMRLGDNTANTKDQFNKLRPLLDTIQKQLLDELKNKWEPESGPGSRDKTPSGGNWWDKAPASNDKRSSVEGSFQVAGDVVPLGTSPSGTTGPAPLEQAINPSGPNIIKLPREIIKDYIRRRSWSELERAVNAQDVG